MKQLMTLILVVIITLLAQCFTDYTEYKCLYSSQCFLYEFGYSVDAYGEESDHILVSSPNKKCMFENGTTATTASMVFAFHFNGSTWNEQQRFSAPDSTIDDRFGSSISISGSFAFIGAPKKSIGSTYYCGSVYVYQFDGNKWNFVQSISQGNTLEYFGGAISIDGDNAIIGTLENKKTYYYQYNGTRWNEKQVFVSPNNSTTDEFGSSVAVSGNYVVIGAASTNNEQGAAYVYHFNGENWDFSQKLLPDNIIEDERFGGKVEMDGNFTIIGADQHFYSNKYYSGGAYIYSLVGDVWVEQELEHSNPGLEDYFGQGVSISKNYAIVGAPGKEVDDSNNFGMAYIYQYNGTFWNEINTFALEKQYSSNDPYFSYFVKMTDKRAFVSANPNGIINPVYVYDVLYKCNGSPDGCGIHGKCISDNICECEEGYDENAPKDCLSFSCAICMNNGSCIGPNTCKCNEGYFGDICEFWECDGIRNDNSLVCSKNGKCTKPDVCDCDEGYFQGEEGKTCVSECPNYITNNGLQCISECPKGQFPNLKNKCEECPENCVSCSDSSKCDECFYHWRGETCSECPNNFEEECKSCEDGYIFDEDDYDCIEETNTSINNGINDGLLVGIIVGSTLLCLFIFILILAIIFIVVVFLIVNNYYKKKKKEKLNKEMRENAVVVDIVEKKINPLARRKKPKLNSFK